MNFSTSANIGDCLWACQFLRRLGGEHHFYVKDAYVEQLAPLMADTAHEIRPISTWPGDGIDCWIANGRYEHKGCYYQNQTDIMGFVMEFFNHMGGEMGMPKPVFDTRADMLWDAPAIGPAKVSKKIIDCLIVNADPLSGQCQGYSRSDLYQKVVLPLIARFGCSVITTNCSDAGTSTGHTLSEIGALATMAKRIITVATGPSWPTWNVWSKDAERIVILDPMRLDFGPMDAPVHHAANADEVRRICEERGWL